MGAALTCLDENSALDFLSGRLGPTALSEAERHLGTCAPCIELLARSAPLFPPRPAGDGMERTPPRNTPSSLATLAMPARRNRFSMTQESDSGSSGDAAAADESGLGDDKPTLPSGTTLKGTYTVLDLIGRGGMGEVYEVRHARLAGRYALKLLPPIFAHEHVSVTRFRREADILSALRHPNIVQVIDFDHTPAGQPFLVMEYLDGGDLAQLMGTVGAMPFPRVLKIVEQIVSALSAVHRRGIVHRDLKPQNVLLVRDEDFATDRVKLVDFGLSKRSEALRDLSGNISRDQTLLGTPRYMAPEQASGRIDEIDATTDQFALAAMIYEMLTGTSAFDGEHMAMLLYRIVSENPAPMRRYVPDLPEHVEAAVRRAMEKQRSDRFATVADFLDALLDRPSLVSAERSSDSARGASAITPPPVRMPTPPGAGQVAAASPARGSRRAVIATFVGMALAAVLAAGWHLSRRPMPAPAATPVIAHETTAPAPPAPPAPPPAATVVPPTAPTPEAVVATTTPPARELAPRVKAHPKSAGRPAKTPRRTAPALSPAPPAEASPAPQEKAAEKVGRLVEEL
jgi:serine/threonine protein kinase